MQAESALHNTDNMLFVPAPYTPVKQVRYTTNPPNQSPSPTDVRLQNNVEAKSFTSASPAVGQRYQLKPIHDNVLRNKDNNSQQEPETKMTLPSGMPLAPTSPVKFQRHWTNGACPPTLPLSPVKYSKPTLSYPHTPTAPACTPFSLNNNQKLYTMSVGRATNRSSPPAVPHMVPTSPNSTAELSHARDNKFAFSKVFQTRYNTAATTLQKHVRRVLAMRHLDEFRRVAHEAAEERRMAREVHRLQVAAAVRIQSLVRRWRTRLHLRVYQLQHQLAVIQRSQHAELQAIADWKRTTRAAIESEHRAHVAQDSAQERLNQDTLDKANQLIRYLRKVNARQRIKNDTLQVAIDQLLAENQMLNEEAARYANFREITHTMSKACNNKSVLLEVLHEFDMKKEAMESAIERRDDRIMFENRVGRLYLNAVRNMVLVVETSSTDERLVYAVEEMCLELEEKGFGLDALEYENSKCDIGFDG